VYCLKKDDFERVAHTYPQVFEHLLVVSTSPLLLHSN
jgi:hypothetical protein